MLVCRLRVVPKGVTFEILEQDRQWSQPWPAGLRSYHEMLTIRSHGYTVHVASVDCPELRLDRDRRLSIFLRGADTHRDDIMCTLASAKHSVSIDRQRAILTACVAAGRRIGSPVEWRA